MGHNHKKHSANFLLTTCLHFFKAVVKIVLIICLWAAKLGGTILVKISEYLEKNVLK